MATATATISKTEQAAQLRAEVQALEKELTKSRANLARAQEALGHLAGKRKKLEEDSARGVLPKAGVVASLLAETAEAQLPVDGLTPLVAEQQAKLTAVRDTLAVVQRELSIAAQREALQARFDALTKQGGEVVPRIRGAIRNLLELLADYDEVRDGLRMEFGDTDKVDAARELLKTFGEQLWDRSVPRVESEMLKEGWKARGDLQFTITNLTPPPKR